MDPAASFDHAPRTRIVFGAGQAGRLGELAAELGARRVLVVTDPGIVAAGHVDRAERALAAAGLEPARFDGVRENPTTLDVERCLERARDARPDLILGLGGGSSLDVAKGCNWCEHGPTGKAGCHTTKQTEHMPAAFTCKADKDERLLTLKESTLNRHGLLDSVAASRLPATVAAEASWRSCSAPSTGLQVGTGASSSAAAGSAQVAPAAARPPPRPSPRPLPRLSRVGLAAPLRRAASAGRTSRCATAWTASTTPS